MPPIARLVNWIVAPVQSSQLIFVAYAPVVMTPVALPGSLTISSFAWLPVTKFAVIAVVLV